MTLPMIPPRNGEGDRPKGGGGVSRDDWNRRVAASRDILEVHYHDPYPEWLQPEAPWSWSAIATLLAALAAGGAAVWWFAA